MNFDIMLLKGDQVVKVGELNWDRAEGKWTFNSSDDDVKNKLLEIGKEGKVRIMRAIYGEDFIADGFEMIGPSNPEFLGALEDELGSVGVLELKASG